MGLDEPTMRALALRQVLCENLNQDCARGDDGHLPAPDLYFILDDTPDGRVERIEANALITNNNKHDNLPDALYEAACSVLNHSHYQAGCDVSAFAVTTLAAGTYANLDEHGNTHTLNDPSEVTDNTYLTLIEQQHVELDSLIAQVANNEPAHVLVAIVNVITADNSLGAYGIIPVSTTPDGQTKWHDTTINWLPAHGLELNTKTSHALRQAYAATGDIKL